MAPAGHGSGSRWWAPKPSSNHTNQRAVLRHVPGWYGRKHSASITLPAARSPRPRSGASPSEPVIARLRTGLSRNPDRLGRMHAVATCGRPAADSEAPPLPAPSVGRRRNGSLSALRRSGVRSWIEGRFQGFGSVSRGPPPRCTIHRGPWRSVEDDGLAPDLAGFEARGVDLRIEFRAADSDAVEYLGNCVGRARERLLFIIVPSVAIRKHARERSET